MSAAEVVLPGTPNSAASGRMRKKRPQTGCGRLGVRIDFVSTGRHTTLVMPGIGILYMPFSSGIEGIGASQVNC